MKLHYIDRKYKPKKDEVVCEFRVEPSGGISLEGACERIASESSIGSWDDIGTLTKKIAKTLKPHVFSINKKTKEVKIAYPSKLFEPGNMPEIMSSIGGNIFGMKAIRNLRLQDIHFPDSILKSFKGPKYGILGIRKLLKVKKRALAGTIIKPKVGLDEKNHARVAYQSWVGGLDICKEDENLASMQFNNFYKRVKETLKMRNGAEKETGERKVYFANVTAETQEMLKRAKYVKMLGGEYVMLDIITAGWAALQTLREADLGLAIHAHRSGHGMFTENPKHGMSMLTVAKIARLIGVDEIHIGAILGKMLGSAKAVVHIGEEISEDFIEGSKRAHILQQNWKNIKPIFPVCSGGLHAGLIEPLIKIMGQDIIVQCGAGVHAHPNGTKAGAASVRQAVDAVAAGIPVKEYARNHRELSLALKKWGHLSPE